MGSWNGRPTRVIGSLDLKHSLRNGKVVKREGDGL